MTDIVSIQSFRRGTGKSTIAANIAGLLARHGRRVGLVDAAFQSPALGLLFGLDTSAPGRSFNDFLGGRCDIEQTAHDLTPMLGATDGGLFLIPASDDPHEIARTLRMGYDLKLLHDGFRTLADELRLDALIVDTYAGLQEESLSLMAVADTLAIVLRHNQQEYQGAGVTLGVARKLEVPRMALIINEAPALLDVDATRAQAELIYACKVAGVLPRSDEWAALAAQAVFVLRYPEHPVTAMLGEIARVLVP